MSRLPSSIEFAKEVPSGRSTSVRAQLDTATGGGAIGRALQGLGAVLSDIGFAELQRTQDAEDAIELSTKKREFSSIMTEGLLAAQETTDQDVANAIFKDAKAKANALTSGSSRVDNALKIHINNTLAVHDRQFAESAFRRSRSNTLADANINIQAAMERGDQTTAIAQWTHLGAFGLVKPAVVAKAIEDMPTNTLLAQASAIASIDPEKAIKDISGLKTLSVEQAKLKESIESRARSAQNRIRQQLKFDANKAITEAVFQLSDIQKKELPPDQLDIALDKVKGELRVNPALSSSEARIAIARISAIRNGSDIITNRPIHQQAQAQIRLLNTESTREQIAEAKQFVMDNQSSLSTNDLDVALKSIDNRLKKDRAQAIDSSVVIAIQRGQITKGFDDANFTAQLKQWADTHPDATAKEIRAQGGEIAADFKKTIARIFTPARVQRLLGELTAQGWFTDLGRSIPIRKGSDAINHALRTLGPNWQRIAPGSASIIQKNWPGTDIPKLDVVPAMPKNVPPDGKWDSNRQMWTWIRKTKAHPEGELFAEVAE